MDRNQAQSQFFAQLGRPWMATELFDSIPDSVFFVKDAEGHYIAANKTLVERCGCRSKQDILGKTARSLFPSPLGDQYTGQDLEIINNGPPIYGELELHLYPNRSQGWCLTWKEAIVNSAGKIVGVAGISRDLPGRADFSHELPAISKALQHIDQHLDAPPTIKELAGICGLSAYQLDQRIRALFGVSVGQFTTRRRIEHACHLLERSKKPLSLIALECGYSDQSAFTRQFRQSVGIPPGTYRENKSTQD